MDELKEVEGELFYHNYSQVLSIIGFLFLIGLILFSDNILSCNDKTLQGKCSDTLPFFCEKGKLIEKAFICGCPNGLIRDGDFCISEYSSNFKNISLNYFLESKEGVIEFVADEGFYNYIAGIPRFLTKKENEIPSREDFKLTSINNEEQRKMILPLVIEIKNRASRKDNQAKIAISLVQNIEYNASEKKIDFFGSDVDYSRYPYEVLYEKQGICGEKSELLALLLKELDYGVAIFYFDKEQHEAVGIKCPSHKDFEDTGYCFIETTSRLENNVYIGATKEFKSKPEVIIIADGKSIGYWF